MGRGPDFIYIIVVIFLCILLFKTIFYRKKPSNSDLERERALFQELLTRLQDRFPDQTFRVDESHPFTIVVPPKHPAVEGLRISDDGNNIMVELGPFAHEHFKSYWREGREGIVLDVLFFVEDVFEDKVEFYGGPGGGGYRERGKKPRGFLDKLFFGKTTYVWSGPKEEQ
jgi:hypothetical protein